MRVLITGVAGFLGSRFADWILRNQPDCDVVGLDDLSGGFLENVPSGVEFHTVRLGARTNGLARVFARPVDLVYHFAAYAAEGLSPFIRCHNYINNVVGTAQLLNAVLNQGDIQRLVYTSSMAVYGRGKPPFNEIDERLPIDPYGVAKAACEADIAIAGQQHGLDWCAIRPHNVYGPGQNIWDPYRNVFGIWMKRRLEGLPLRIYGDGEQRRAFSWIDDCLPCLWAAGTAPEASRQTINLGGKSPISLNEAVLYFTSAAGQVGVEYETGRHEVKDAWSTWQRSADLLGYRETMGLAGCRAS
jgi:UDP-glucose 4-epimerase